MSPNLDALKKIDAEKTKEADLRKQFDKMKAASLKAAVIDDAEMEKMRTDITRYTEKEAVMEDDLIKAVENEKLFERRATYEELSTEAELEYAAMNAACEHFSELKGAEAETGRG